MTTYRKCTICKKKVLKEDASYNQLKAFCCFEHMIKYTKSPEAQKTIAKVHRAEIAKAMQRLKTKTSWLAEAQAAFNKYIRMRDRYHKRGCISCDLNWKGIESSGVDAGHYISRRVSGLRFNSWNVHAQCKHDNRYMLGNIIEYRKRLIQRIGLAKVEWLEANTNSSKKLSIHYLQRVKSIFTKRARLMEKRIQ